MKRSSGNPDFVGELGIFFLKFKVKTVNWKGSIEALLLYISRKGGVGDCIVKLNIWIICDSVYLFQYMIKQ